MEIEELRAFQAVAELGSFSRAAERIHLTQPAISKRIANLEHKLQAQLFDRIGGSVQLTSAGALLLERAAEVLLELEDIRRGISNLSGGVNGSVVFATSHHIGLHRLPPVLERFHQNFPQVKLDIRFLDSEQGCQQVARGELEFAVVTLPPQVEPPLQTRMIWHDPIHIVAAADHPLAIRSAPLSLKHLLRYSALLPAPETYTRRLVMAAFGNQAGKVNIEISSNYLEVLKMLTRVGLGWSTLPDIMLDEHLVTLEVPELALSRELGVVTHERRTLSNAGQAFISLLEGFAQPSQAAGS